jgi:RNA polymerase sigma factor (sigma-70 family)
MLRKEGQAQIREIEHWDDIPDKSNSIEERLDLYDAIEQLNPLDAQIIQLCMQGMSVNEIAEECGITRWTVRTHRDRALHQLRRLLS